MLVGRPAEHTVLVISEERDNGTVTALTALLGQDGFPVINLAIDNLIGDSEVIDTAVASAIQDLISRGHAPKSLVYVHPEFTFQGGQFAQHFAAEKVRLQIPFFAAKYLQSSFNQYGQTERINFLCVTQIDGQLGWGRRGDTSILGRGLSGLVKSLNLEWSPVFCRYADIAPKMADKDKASSILAELWDADTTIQEVGVTEQGRTKLGTRLIDVPAVRPVTTKVTEQSVFLVSGGAKGVTAACVIAMAKTFKCKFILLGRSDFNFELPDYAQSPLEDGVLKRRIMEAMKAAGEQPSLAAVKQLAKQISAKLEIKDTLDKIKAAGSRAIYVQGDVTKATSIRLEIKQAEKALGLITGVIHGAGRLADKYIQDKTANDFNNVLSVKLDGLLSLLSCVDINQLQHLVLFSSVAGFYGNVGQTDYAMANEILSAAAHLFKTNHPKTQVTAINWGAWDSGMVSDSLKKKFAEAGVSLVSTEGGPEMMINELSVEYADQPQVIIGGTLPAAVSTTDNGLLTYQIRRELLEADNPFLQHHVIQGKAVLPVVNAVGWMAQTCDRLYPDFRVFKIEDAKLYKGLVFDGTGPEVFTVSLKELSKDQQFIRFKAKIASDGPKLPIYHYGAAVTLVHKDHRPSKEGFTPAISEDYAVTLGQQLYVDGSLFHGKYFRGINEIVDLTPSQMILKCTAPDVPLVDQGQFPVDTVNTFFADIQYQGMVVWVQHYFGGAKSLPLATDTVTIYEKINFEKPLLVHIEIVESNAFKLAANCTVYDETGKVYMITEGAAVTVSKELEW